MSETKHIKILRNAENALTRDEALTQLQSQLENNEREGEPIICSYQTIEDDTVIDSGILMGVSSNGVSQIIDQNGLEENINNIEDKLEYKKHVVIAVAGQSNAVGYDESSVTGSQYKNRNTDRIKQLGCYEADGLELIDLGHCAHNIQDMTAYGDNGTKGIHLPLANLMLDYIPEDYGVIIIPVAYGSAKLTSGNLGTYNEELLRPNELTTQLTWQVGGAYYQTLVDRVKWALNLNAENLFAGVVWIQGESDSSNATLHATNFDALTTQFFSDLEGYSNQSITGSFDKNIWYNVETTNMWYNTPTAGCVNIWGNYKTWNADTYVEIPRDTLTNTSPSSTSSYPASHFGQNAYEDVIAPRVMAAMLKHFPNKSTDEETETSIVYDYITENNITHEEKTVALKEFVDGTMYFESSISGSTCKYAWSDCKPYVLFNEGINEFEFTATRGQYWLIVGGTSYNDITLYSIGKTNNSNSTAQIANISNGTFTRTRTANTKNKLTEYGTIVHVKRTDTQLFVTLKYPDSDEFVDYLSDYRTNFKDGDALGFAYGISSLESALGDDNTTLFENLKILGTLKEVTVNEYNTIQSRLTALEEVEVWDAGEY